MGSGEVTADTKSTGHYDALSHHRIIRNGLEIEATEGIVALEYHYDDNTSSHTMMLNSFLAPYMPDFGDSALVCFR